MAKSRNLPLHTKILFGIILGIVVGVAFAALGWNDLVIQWIKPFGTIFIKLLKLIAIPLILVSLVKGVADLKDITKFKTMGLRTFGWYMLTTVFAIIIGLLVVNSIQPGKIIDSATLKEITSTYAEQSSGKIEQAQQTKSQSPLQPLVDIVPDNIFKAAGENTNMLQVIFFAIFFGIALLLTPNEFSSPIEKVFTSLNEVVMRMVDMVMLFSPYAVFALIASVIAEIPHFSVFYALGGYMGTVLLGLVLMLFFYSFLVKFQAKFSPLRFIKAISPAQLLAFSTSSSAATLPVTMERVEEHLGVDEEVTSFVCPLGATINMDGTSLYQAVAAVFICQAVGFEITLQDQLTIVWTALLASIGSAAVPGAGMIMLIIVLESVGIPSHLYALGIALIFAVDRPLDMCRTVINITGDSTVALLIGKKMGKIHSPKERVLL